MENRDIQEVVIGAGLIVLLVFAVNPFGIFMPTQLTMMIVFAAAIVALLFASFIWREKSEDEREDYHRLLASRAGYLAGAAVLLIGMIVQAWRGYLDGWLALTLGVMVIAKLASHVYNNANR